MPESPIGSVPDGPVPEALAARLRSAGCVFAEDEARLLAEAAHTPSDLEDLLQQRIDGLPLEHVLGWAEFCGLRVRVDAGVFVPRRRSEFLVHCAAGVVAPGSFVVDMCCGCGAIGAALAAVEPAIRLHAADVDPAAVRCARRNLEGCGGDAHCGDLYTALPDSMRGRIDVVVANAPYVPSAAIATMPSEARLHEPRVALDGGADGLDVHRRLAASASEWLAPGGHLLMEAGSRQAEAATEILAAEGLTSVVHRSDEFDATVVVGVVHDRSVPSQITTRV
ncbi:putative protein N(5)-glutamine methyltransferase [Rhodococcus artemisiae]|uniref:peptide chain release factor N(5)-glutamine methyltransferase n=1 Tax=Rhodococcus artemisiae TaxID=714159 RepID=A0ABU7L906_9NOCA|nr:putative protein N(5)-glutamine methyltransferase [Rhodococcus artemisiae]MEE2058029.1 putative protein N(5)-glutamine methyltransferase [Rhodococcus artemisiae]